MTDMRFGTITLGAMVNTLAKLDPASLVHFDFCNAHPTLEFWSYRGHYDHLAMGVSLEQPKTDAQDGQTVGALLSALRLQVGKTHCGWKGGNFTMDDDTPLWAEKDARSCSGTAIISVTDLGYGYVVLNTGYVK